MFSQDDGVDLFKLYEKQIIAKKESWTSDFLSVLIVIFSQWS